MAGGRISGGSLDASVLRAAVTGHPEYVQYKTPHVCKPYSVSCLFLPRTRRPTRTDVVSPPPSIQRASARDNRCLRSERHHQRIESRSPIAVRPCMPFPSSGQCNKTSCSTRRARQERKSEDRHRVLRWFFGCCRGHLSESKKSGTTKYKYERFLSTSRRMETRGTLLRPLETAVGVRWLSHSFWRFSRSLYYLHPGKNGLHLNYL